MAFEKMNSTKLRLRNIFLILFLICPNIAVSLCNTTENQELKSVNIYALFILTFQFFYLCILTFGLYGTAFSFKKQQELREQLGFNYKTKVDSSIRFVFYCFFLTIFFYANLYQFLFAYGGSGTHFNFANSTDNLNLINSLYFSTITSATVGYGDIYPKSEFSRLIVTSQIIISLVYVSALISKIVGNTSDNNLQKQNRRIK